MIEELEIENFKSFGKRTKLVFSRGMNVIIGPNGSGKSNIIDSIIFVLGEGSRKELRAEKMENLIHFGKEKAYVKIKIKEKENIVIERELSKDGKSVYRLNGKRVSRQMILDSLKKMDIDPNGFNIVLQGEIIEFADMSSLERRKLIEDIAGISYWDEKKQKALIELEGVENKLREVKILMNEREERLNQLKIEKEEAEEFLRLKKELENKEKLILWADYLMYKKKLEKEEKKKEEFEKKLEEKERIVQELTNEINKLKGEKESIEKRIDEFGGKKYVEIRKEYENAVEEKKRIEIEIEGIKKELKKIEDRKRQIEENIKEDKNNINLFNEEIEKYNKEIEKLDKEIKNKKELINKVRLAVQYDSEKIRKILNAKKEINNLREQYSHLINQIKNLIEEHNKIKEKLGNFRKEIEELEREKNKLEVRRAPIIDPKILDFDGVYGAFYELGSVDKKYSLALRVAAGDRIKAIVVDNEVVAEKIINFLRNNKLGIATLVPLNKINPPNVEKYKEYLKEEGVIDFAFNLVNFNPKFKKAFIWLFGGTLVVKDFETAKKLMGKVRMVTLDGDLFDRSGAITGGYRKEGIGFLDEEIEQKIEFVENRLNSLYAEYRKLEREKEEIESRIMDLREKRAEIDFKIKDYEEYAKMDIDEKILEKWKELQEYKKYDLNKLEKELANLEEKYKEIKIKRDSLNFQIENVLKKDLENLNKVLKSLEKEKEYFDKKLEEDKKILEDLEAEINRKKEGLEGIMKEVEELFVKKEEINKKIVEIEENIDKINEEILKLKGEIEKSDLIIKEYKKRMEEINVEDMGVEVDKKELEKEIEVIKEKIEKIGAVNLKAIEEYGIIKKEFEEAFGKYKKIEEEKKKILDYINEIESKKKEKFMEYFNKINSKFREIFRGMHGGEAKLILENQNNPFAGGVKIEVTKNGKKVSLFSLSGGEKTLLALSLIFAIPTNSPFYILDEVDAALDKENSEKFSNYLKEISKEKQIIIVSHNDSIISKGDVLWGIALENGYSKAYSVKL